MNKLINWCIPKITIDTNTNRIEFNTELDSAYVSRKKNEIIKITKKYNSLSYYFIILDDLVNKYWYDYPFQNSYDFIHICKQYSQELYKNFKSTKVNIIRISETLPYMSYQKKYNMIYKTALFKINKDEVSFRRKAYCSSLSEFDYEYSNLLAKRAYSIFASEYWFASKLFKKNTYIVSSANSLENSRYAFAEQCFPKIHIPRISIAIK